MYLMIVLSAYGSGMGTHTWTHTWHFMAVSNPCNLQMTPRICIIYMCMYVQGIDWYIE